MIIGAGQDTAHRAPKINTITCGDCLEVMQAIPDKSIDMILCDLPYGTTQCKWDSVLPLSFLWEQYTRVCTGAIVLTAMQPFTSALVMSNVLQFKYDMCWKKSNVSGFLNAKKRPLRQHEDILVFCSDVPKYNPQFFVKPSVRAAQKTVKREGQVYGDFKEGVFRSVGNEVGYPRSVIEFSTAYHAREAGLHPTQKPVALFEYLIRTYTNEGDTVLDNCIGSGTTAIACINTNRNFIGIEKEEKYCRIAEERIHALRSPAQNTMEICHTAPNSASMQNAQVEMDLL